MTTQPAKSIRATAAKGRVYGYGLPVVKVATRMTTQSGGYNSEGHG